MENRFKFRVWLNKLNRYSKNTDNLLLSEDGNVCEFDTVGCYSEKDVVIQQCTGLKDRNGRLIYEGDIVKVSGYGVEGIFEMLWDDTTACFCTSIYESDCFEHSQSVMEVIGNIYENKELLNGNKRAED